MLFRDSRWGRAAVIAVLTGAALPAGLAIASQESREAIPVQVSGATAELRKLLQDVFSVKPEDPASREQLQDQLASIVRLSTNVVEENVQLRSDIQKLRAGEKVPVQPIIITQKPPTPDPMPPKSDPPSTELLQRLAAAESAAGWTTVEGPGVQITLKDSPRTPPKGVDPKSLQIHDQDVNAILDTLRNAGAEALCIGGATGPAERILAVTATRDVGSGLIVNGSRLVPPFKILAIGDVKTLRTELMRKDGVIQSAGLAALQMVTVSDQTRVEIPAARPLSFKLAKPVADGSQPSPPVAAATPSTVAPSGNPPAATAGVRQSQGGPIAIVPRTSGNTTAKPGTGAPAGTVKTAGPATAPASKPAVGMVFGGKQSKKYHVAGCRFGERYPASLRDYFGSPEEAEKQKRTPCEVCLPERAARFSD
jgi:uncharacterized protein YlxW (UPF0749 family)